MKISIDLDGVLCDFWLPYLNRFGTPKNDLEVTRNVQRKLKNDKEFWLTLPVLNQLNWTPNQYTTARIISKSWIREYLDKENFPKAPIYQVPGYSLSKYAKIKMNGCDLHIDDSLSVFIDLNLRGIPCLLVDAPNNKNWEEPIGRIYSLDMDEIVETYHLFKNTLFPYFKELVI